MKANEIINILGNLEGASYQKVLIDGRWGIGKTEYVNQFIQKYTNGCVVSLFGKKDINSIIEEIYFYLIDNYDKDKKIKKKSLQAFKKVFSGSKLSFPFVTLTVPLIEDVHKTLQKELVQKESFLIVLDDFERKQDELSIKEVLGLVDSLSKIDNIKIVLVAATNQFEGDNKIIFTTYKEKAIERTYHIHKYADDAPQNILGEEIWGILRNYAGDLDNLRTFEKTKLFIKEVLQELGDVFTDKFTKADVYRMCFASIYFHVECKGKLELIHAGDFEEKLTYEYYKSNPLEYLLQYFLKNSLDNLLSKEIFNHLEKWYKTGEYSKESIFGIIHYINTHEEKAHNFYSSQEEIIQFINQTELYIKNLTGNESLADIIYNLSNALDWCDGFSMEFGLKTEEILEAIKVNISNEVDITQSAFHNLDHQFHFEKEKMSSIINIINLTLLSEYFKQLLTKIKEFISHSAYDNIAYLRTFSQSIFSVDDKEIREEILNDIRSHNFYFPIPSGKITKEQWYWCHQINTIIKDIDRHWNEQGFYDEFMSYANNSAIENLDKMLQIRLKNLFKD